ncbi:MAG: ankyrin repeat domain-containing protein, partial [Nitrospinota bacterium]
MNLKLIYIKIFAVLPLATLLHLLYPPGYANSKTLDDANRAVIAREYAKAASILKTFSEEGDASAQYQLARLYRLGRGVPRDLKRAFFWFSRASEQGHSKAQYNLGVMFEKGLGTSADLEEAGRWLYNSAGLGNLQAKARAAKLSAADNLPYQNEKGLEKKKHPKMVSMGWAAASGSRDKVIALLKQGADINTVDDLGNTPLMEAVLNGRTAVVNILLKAGADVKRKNRRGEDALLLASKIENTAVVLLLVEAGAFINTRDLKGNTPLINAVKKDSLALTRVFMVRGADPEIRNKKGFTPLDIALKKDFTSISKYLFSHGLRPGKRKRTGNTPGEKIYLPGSGNSDHRFFYKGWPELMIAAWLGKAKSIKSMLAAGHDPNL